MVFSQWRFTLKKNSVQQVPVQKISIGILPSTRGGTKRNWACLKSYFSDISEEIDLGYAICVVRILIKVWSTHFITEDVLRVVVKFFSSSFYLTSMKVVIIFFMMYFYTSFQVPSLIEIDIPYHASFGK